MREMESRAGAEGQSFHAYTVSQADRRVLFRGRALALGAAGFAIMAAAIERRGAALAEDELLALLEPFGATDLARLWECVAELNGTLAWYSPQAGYIAHFPDAGFMLVVSRGAGSHACPGARASAVVGRCEAIANIAEQLARRRFVSIVGPGGMGKTTVALALIEQLARFYADGSRFLDLAALAGGRSLPAALAAALGMPQAGEHVFPGLAPFLRNKQMLVVLDSCEYVTEAAAAAAEALLRAAPGLHVIATSREPLRAAGEWVHRLAPMGLPEEGGVLSAAQALDYSAVQLFVGRANADAAGAHGGTFEFTDAQAAPVSELCRQLDGVPLALELAAALVAPLGLDRLSAQLGERLLRPVAGRRRAADRHLSLAAMLDWSYDLLCAREQCVLRRLAVFRAGFTLEAAGAVAADAALPAAEVLDAVLDLMAKSLVSTGTEDGGGRHRLLDTTRAYAFAKLCESGERQLVQRRHARYLCQLLEGADSCWERMARAAWLALYAPWIGDVRFALDWAFGEGGDAMLGVELTAVSFSLGDQAALSCEFGARVEHALAVLARLPDPPPLLRMRLCNYFFQSSLASGA
jgi:predicted ATPase